MNKHLITLALLVAPLSALACTGLIATRGATADSSVMATYAADSHTLYGSLVVEKGGNHPAGAMRKIVDWDSGRPLGEIPQVRHTYTRVGNMNEKGLTVTESTWGGRPELEDHSGLIDYGSLIQLALERCSTAREAVKLMTDLVAEYGYASEGESFTIADADEAWILELIGKGGKSKGAVWVARRIPDGYISGHANHSRIHRFPLDDPENTLYSPDVIDFARSQGYYEGPDSLFSFSRAYAITDVGATRGCDARVWSFFRRYTSPEEMDAYLPWILKAEGEPLPLWVKPSHKLSVADMRNMMRDHFEGNALDMTQPDDIGAGPFDVPYRWRPMSFTVDSITYTNERAIATQQTGFSLVAQMNHDFPEAMRGIQWFGVDDANTCVYIPVFCTVDRAPHELSPDNGDLLTLSWDSMFWVNNYVANQAYNRYSQMIPDIRKVQSALEDQMDGIVAEARAKVPTLKKDKAQKYLQSTVDKASADVTSQYKQLGDYLLVKFLDGNVKKQNADGSFQRNEHGLPVQPSWPGYNERYYRSIAKSPAGERLIIPGE